MPESIDWKKFGHEASETTIYAKVMKHIETCTPCRLILESSNWIIHKHLEELESHK